MWILSLDVRDGSEQASRREETARASRKPQGDVEGDDRRLEVQLAQFVLV